MLCLQLGQGPVGLLLQGHLYFEGLALSVKVCGVGGQTGDPEPGLSQSFLSVCSSVSQPITDV